MTESIATNYGITKFKGEHYVTIKSVPQEKIKNGLYTDASGNVFESVKIGGKETWVCTDRVLSEDEAIAFLESKKSEEEKYGAWYNPFKPSEKDRSILNLWNGFTLFDDVNKEYDGVIEAFYKSVIEAPLLSSDNPDSDELSASDILKTVALGLADAGKAIAQNPVKTIVGGLAFAGLCLIPGVGPLIGWGAALVGGGFGVISFGKGAVQAFNAKTKQEKQAGLREATTGAFTIILSAIGLRGMRKINKVKYQARNNAKNLKQSCKNLINKGLTTAQESVKQAKSQLTIAQNNRTQAINNVKSAWNTKKTIDKAIPDVNKQTEHIKTVISKKGKTKKLSEVNIPIEVNNGDVSTRLSNLNTAIARYKDSKNQTNLLQLKKALAEFESALSDVQKNSTGTWQNAFQKAKDCRNAYSEANANITKAQAEYKKLKDSLNTLTADDTLYVSGRILGKLNFRKALRSEWDDAIDEIYGTMGTKRPVSGKLARATYKPDEVNPENSPNSLHSILELFGSKARTIQPKDVYTDVLLDLQNAVGSNNKMNIKCAIEQAKHILAKNQETLSKAQFEFLNKAVQNAELSLLNVGLKGNPIFGIIPRVRTATNPLFVMGTNGSMWFKPDAGKYKKEAEKYLAGLTDYQS